MPHGLIKSSNVERRIHWDEFIGIEVRETCKVSSLVLYG